MEMNSTIIILRYTADTLCSVMRACSVYLAEIELPRKGASSGGEYAEYAELQGVVVTAGRVRNPETGRMIKENGALAKRLAKKGVLPL